MQQSRENERSIIGKGLRIPTMSSKSLWKLALIYAIDELQNPLRHKTMLYEGDMNNPAGMSGAFLHS